jgi:hypothetical protein
MRWMVGRHRWKRVRCRFAMPADMGTLRDDTWKTGMAHFLQ